MSKSPKKTPKNVRHVKGEPIKANNPWHPKKKLSRNEEYEYRKLDPLPEASPFWIIRSQQLEDKE